MVVKKSVKSRMQLGDADSEIRIGTQYLRENKIAGVILNEDYACINVVKALAKFTIRGNAE